MGLGEVIRRATLVLLVLALITPAAGRADTVGADCQEPAPLYEPSAPVHQVLAERYRYVEMEDGTKIRVDIYRPDSSGKFPVMVWFDVYYKDDANAVVNAERNYFVERGYVFVHASSPGSNTSGGSYDNAFGPLEQEAATAVVEWAGKQAWSTGRVGMNGLSYAAIIQYFVAARRPEHLVTIYPASAYSDLYREIVYIGGNLQLGYPVVWDLNNRSFAYLPPMSSGPEPVSDVSGYATSVGGWRPILGDFLLHPNDDEFHRTRSPRWTNSQIDVPFALDVGWYDDMLHGGPINYETVGSVAKRLVIGPWGHSETHRREGGRFERLRWFDHYLKDLPSRVECDSPVRIFVPEGGRAGASAGRGIWRNENEWPIARTRYEELFLGSGSSLVSEAPTTGGSATYRYLPERSQLWEGVAFRSAPLEEDLEVVGYAELVLHASTQQLDTHFTVVVEDEAPGGTRTPLASGWLRAAAREVDEAVSQPGRPFHRFQGDLPVPIGQVVTYRIAIWPIANLFKAGHRIRVNINDSAVGPGGLPFVTPPFPGTNTVHFGAATPSRLVFPVIPRLEYENSTP